MRGLLGPIRWIGQRANERDHVLNLLIRERASPRCHQRGLSDPFIDWFGIAGPEEVAFDRFAQLENLGLDFCYVTTGSMGADRTVARASMERFSRAFLHTHSGGSR